MRKLVSLMILVSILFSFWSCVNQEDDTMVEEQNENQTFLKRGVQRTLIRYDIYYPPTITLEEREAFSIPYINEIGEFAISGILGIHDIWFIYDEFDFSAPVSNTKCTKCVTITLDDPDIPPLYFEVNTNSIPTLPY